MTVPDWSVVDHWLDRLGWSGVPEPRPHTTKAKGHYTQREIAAELGVSPARVDQLEKQALRKCLDYCERNGYALSDLLR